MFCFIVVPLPPGKNSLAIYLNNNSNLGQEATLKKHVLSLNTWQKLFSRIPQKMNLNKKNLSKF
jgi:hypothetical protein